MSALPTVHRALVVKETEGEPKTLVVTQKAVPSFGDDDVLIKVKAVTLNPTDWKHLRFALKDGSSLGSDYAGDVVAVGKNAEAKGWKVGDAAAGYTRGGMLDVNNGAFQEYIVSPADLTWHVPTDVLSYEDAAAMGGIALSTAAQALYHKLKLPTPWQPATEPETVLIWAGSTSVGIYAIRLAKLSGLKVVTVGSPKNHELLKELGADAVFDYKDPEAPRKIKEWSQGKITKAFDTISEHGSTALAAEALSDDGGVIITLLPVQRGETGALATRVEPRDILVYTALEKGQDYDDMSDWNKHVPDYAKELKVMPLKRWEGGLSAVPEALAYLEAGKASAQKISLVFN